MVQYNIKGLAQDSSNSIANALELLQSCTEPSTCYYMFHRSDWREHESEVELASWASYGVSTVKIGR